MVKPAITAKEEMHGIDRGLYHLRDVSLVISKRGRRRLGLGKYFSTVTREDLERIMQLYPVEIV